MNNIMPRLDLTDSVSIIFSLILLQARAEAAGPDEEGGCACVRGGGGKPVWIEAFTPGAKSFNHQRKLSFIKYLTDTMLFGCQ